MSYILNSVTIRTDNSQEGMSKIAQLWRDIESGALPVLFDSEHNFIKGISPVSSYSNYESDENGKYDFTVMGVRTDFFAKTEERVNKGLFMKYEESGDDITESTQKAWTRVWQDSKNGVIQRSFKIDYESSVPAEYAKDGKAHCYLYISVK